MITLVLGGTRSGKSAVAERLAAELAPGGSVHYVATAALDTDDPDHWERIERHRARRPEVWRTVECLAPADLPAALETTRGVLLVDSLGTWVTAHPDLVLDPGNLLATLARRIDPTIVVSEEVGLAIHPTTELGRRFVDVLGELNQAVSAIADRVLLVVAGRTIELPPC